MTTAAPSRLDLDRAILRCLEAVKGMQAEAIRRAQAGETSFGVALEQQIADVVRELRGLASLLASVLASGEVHEDGALVADDRAQAPRPIECADIGAPHGHDEGRCAVPALNLLREEAQRRAQEAVEQLQALRAIRANITCPNCGALYLEGDWPFCASKANPQGHSRGTYGFRMR